MNDENETVQQSPGRESSDHMSALLCDWYQQTEKEIDPRVFCPDGDKHQFGDTYIVTRERKQVGWLTICEHCGVQMFDDAATNKSINSRYFAPGEDLVRQSGERLYRA